MNDLNAYFGFLTEPFSKEMPAKSLFLTEQLKKLFQRLQRLLKRRGIALITGEVGSGKSTAIRAFAENVEKKQIDFVYVDDPTVGMRGIFNSIANQLNLTSQFFKWQLMTGLKSAIEKNCHDYGKTTVVVIDEAQMLNLTELEELRLFTNYKFDSHSPMTLILLAQPEFNRRIKLKALEAFTQRLVLRTHLTGLSKQEARQYIKHHLDVAGKTEPLFSDDVITEIFQQAKGIPRLINTLCYECLVETFLQQKNIVDIATLEKVLLNYDEL